MRVVRRVVRFVVVVVVSPGREGQVVQEGGGWEGERFLEKGGDGLFEGGEEGVFLGDGVPPFLGCVSVLDLRLRMRRMRTVGIGAFVEQNELLLHGLIGDDEGCCRACEQGRRGGEELHLDD